MVDLDPKESLLAVRNQLDEIDKRIDTVSNAYWRQTRAIEKLKRNQLLQHPFYVL